MRVYEIEIEWKDDGQWKVWSSKRLLASSFDEAVKKARKLMRQKQRVLQCVLVTNIDQE
jgi:hypothetical protein